MKIPSFGDFALTEIVNYDTEYGPGNKEHPDPGITEVDRFIASQVSSSPISFRRILWKDSVQWSTPFKLSMHISYDKDFSNGQLTVAFFQEGSDPSNRAVNGYRISGPNPADLILKMKRDTVFKGFIKSKLSSSMTKPILVAKLRSQLSPKTFVEYLKVMGPAEDRGKRDSSGPWAKSGSSTFDGYYNLALAIERGWAIDEKWLMSHKDEIVKLAEWADSSAYHSSKLELYEYDESSMMLHVRTSTTHYYD